MFYQESLKYFLNHKYGFSLPEAETFAKAEIFLSRFDDDEVKIRVEHEIEPDLSWAHNWKHEPWLLRQLNKKNLGCYVVFLEKKNGIGNWEKIDVVGGIVCHEDDLRVYEAEIVKDNQRKL